MTRRCASRTPGANPGHLVNGAFSLPQPLQAQGGTSAFAAISASPLTLKTYAAPVSNDVVPIGFKQAIGANDALRTGTLQQDAHVHAEHDEPVARGGGGAAAPAPRGQSMVKRTVVRRRGSVRRA